MSPGNIPHSFHLTSEARAKHYRGTVPVHKCFRAGRHLGPVSGLVALAGRETGHVLSSSRGRMSAMIKQHGGDAGIMPHSQIILRCARC